MPLFFKNLNRFALLLAGCVLLLGAYTRLTDAGLGCPDWPGCYGHLAVPNQIDESIYPNTPLVTGKAWTEMIHRYLASSLGLCILLLASISFIRRNKLHQPKRLPAALLLLVIAQGLLGMWTVTLKLHPTIVMLHLIGGFTTFSLLWWLLLQQNNQALSAPAPTRFLRITGLLALLALIFQIFLGGWTSSNYAAIICPDFPYCQGKLVPPMDFREAFNLLQPIGPNFAGGLFENTARVTIHMMHRFGAIATTLFVLTFLGGLFKNGNLLLRRMALIIFLLIVTQLSLGILNIIKYLPLPIAVAHHGCAALLLLALIKSNWLLWRPAKENHHGEC